MVAAPDVSVVIPHAGDPALLERCLESLGDDRVREVLVVIAEQATESLDLAQRHPEAQAVRVPTLLSFARATNLAAKRAKGELLFLLNDDTAVEEGAIDRLAETLDAEPSLGAVGGLLLNPDGTPQPSVYADPSWRTLGELILSPLFRRPPLARLARFPYATPPGRETAAVWLSGAALMTRRRLFEEVGGLDEGYPHGVEDAAMCRAIRSRGRALALVEDARIVHDLGRSSYRSERSSQQVSKALVGGSAGWMRYWDEQGAGRMSRATLRLALVLFGLSRVVAYSLGAVVPGPWRGRLRFQRDAYVGYVRSMLSRRSSKAEGVSA